MTDTSTLAPTADAQTVLGALHWRYAVKQFDGARTIDDETWEALEEAITLSPSSFGLQPWKFLVVTDPKVKESLVEHSWGQRQVADCSHLLVIAAKKSHTPQDTARYIALNAQVRGVEATSLDGFAQVIDGSISARTPEEVHEWNKRQCYIALGVFLSAAALLGVDACPMEGFAPAAYDEVLGLSGSDYGALVVASAGYRSPEDKYAHLPKVRYIQGEVIEHI